jgi:hypothetical protein
MKIKEAIQEPMMSHLLDLCKNELNLDTLPRIILIDKKPFIKSGNRNSFGEFDGTSIKVITMNRHPMDVMRTLAHELTHWQQLLNGEKMDGSDGSDIENHANSMAGVILRKFGEQYPECFVNSLP